jgi:hypothetical protein
MQQSRRLVRSNRACRGECASKSPRAWPGVQLMPGALGHTLSIEVLLMNWLRRPALVAACVAASSCSSSGPSTNSGGETTAGFQTSQLQYEVKRFSDGIEIHIPYVYRNMTGDSVYFMNCNGIIVPSLEKQTENTWSSVWVGPTPACLSAPVVVPPQGEYTDTVRVRSDPDMYPLLSVPNIEGTYRLVWHGVVHFYRSDVPQSGTPLPQDERTSNEFALTAAR